MIISAAFNSFLTDLYPDGGPFDYTNIHWSVVPRDVSSPSIVFCLLEIFLSVLDPVDSHMSAVCRDRDR